MTGRQRDRRRQSERRQYRREQRRARQDARRRRRRFLYLVVSGVIGVLIIVSFAVQALPGGRGQALQTGGTNQASYVDGVGEQQPIMETAVHRDGSTISYNTVPPASGDHYSTQAQCRFYGEEVRDEEVVHNLEHGHVVVSYNLSETEDIERLREIHNNLEFNENWLVTRRYSKIGEGEMALAAWGVLDRFDGVDEERIRRFYNTYRGNTLSPETRGTGSGIPCR